VTEPLFRADQIQQDALRDLGLSAPTPTGPADLGPTLSNETMLQIQRDAAAAVMNRRLIIGGPDARMAMFPDEFAKKPEDRPNYFERGARGIATGIAQMIPSSMILAGGVLDFLGADEAGQQLAETGISWEQWLNEHVAVENPKFFDHLANGVGSMMGFIIPGLGTEALAVRLGLAGRVLGKVLGLTTMSAVEAGIEQAQRQEELMSQGMTAEEALGASQPVFWQNMALLMATNAPLWSPAGRIARAAMSFITEGGQERFQSVIQDVAAGRGTWSDFWDPEKYGTETLVGSLVGAGAGLVMPQEVPSSKEDTQRPSQAPQEAPGEAQSLSGRPVEFGPGTQAGAREAAQQRQKKAYWDEKRARKAEQEVRRHAKQDARERLVGDDAYALGRVSASLSQEYGVDINLAERLTPEQAGAVATLARQAETLSQKGDSQAAWEKAEDAYNLAEDYLFRSGARTEASAAEAAAQRQQEIEAKQAARDERRAAKQQARMDRRAQRSLEQATEGMEAPDLFPPQEVGLFTGKPLKKPTRAEVEAKAAAREEGYAAAREDVAQMEADRVKVQDLERAWIANQDDGKAEDAYFRALDAYENKYGETVEPVEAVVDEQNEALAAMSEGEVQGWIRQAGGFATAREILDRARDVGIFTDEDLARFKKRDAQIAEAERQAMQEEYQKSYDRARKKERKAEIKAEAEAAGFTIEQPVQKIQRKAKQAAIEKRGRRPEDPYTASLVVNDFDGNRLGVLVESHEGTPESLSAANDRLRAQAEEQFGSKWTNAGSVTIATDEDGNPRWRVSPNSRMIDDVSQQARTDMRPEVKDEAVGPETDGTAPPSPENIEGRFVVSGIRFDQQRGIGAVPDQGNVNYMGYTVFMTPQEFLDLNPPRPEGPLHGPTANRIRAGEPVASPFLQVRYKDGKVVITGHEGRGRALVLREMAPDAKIPVNVFGPRDTRAGSMKEELVRAPLEPDSRRGAIGKAFTPDRIIWKGKDLSAVQPAAGVGPKIVEVIEGKSARGIILVPTVDLHIEPATLQTRTNIDNPESGTNEAKVQAILDDFDVNKMDPIVAWRDPKDGLLKVLDGHHTLEAAKRMGVLNVNVKIFEGTREEALQESKELNDRVSVNDIFSRAATVRSNREGGMPETLVKKKAKSLYKEQTPTILYLSRLNPKGKAISVLQSLREGSDEYNRVLRYAKWIGEARERFPTLTDSHEREMFDFLEKNGRKDNLSSASAFIAVVESRGNMGSFTGMESLNLARATAPKGSKARFEEQLKTLEDWKKELQRRKAHPSEVAESEIRDLEDRIKTSTDEKEKADLEARLAKRKGELEALKTRKAKELQDLIDHTDQQIIKLKQEWRAAQDRLAFGGEQTLFNVFDRGDERANFQAFRRDMKQRWSDFVKDVQQVEPGNDPHLKLISDILRRFGVKTVFFRPVYQEANDRVAGGGYSPSQRTAYINIENPAAPLLPVAMHEVGHHVQKNHPDLWNQIIRVASRHMIPGGYNVYKAERLALGYTEDQIMGEFMSDVFAEVAAKEAFWKDLKRTNPTAFSAVVNKLMDVLRSIRNFFRMSPAYFGVEAYFDNFGAIEQAVSRAMSEVAAREFRSQVQENPYQGDMFESDVLRNETPLMRAEVQRLREAEKGVQTQRARRGWGLLREVYKKFFDQNTWLHVAVKKAWEAAGHPFETLKDIENPHKWLQGFASWTKSAQTILTTAVPSWLDPRNILSDGLEVIIRKFGIADDVENGVFGRFLVAARLKAMYERHGDDFFRQKGAKAGDNQGSLFEYAGEQEQAAREEFADQMRLYNEYKDKPGWLDAVAAITKFSNATLQRALESGMISDEQYADMVLKYDVYAPLFVLEKEGAPMNQLAYEMDTLIPGQVRMDPIEGLIKTVYRREFLIAYNAAKMSAADFVRLASDGEDALEGFGRKVPTPDEEQLQGFREELESAADPNDPASQRAIDAAVKMYRTGTGEKGKTLTFMRDGELETWEFTPEIVDTFLTAHHRPSHQLMKFFTAQTRLLRAGAVLTPEFMSRNQLRDLAAAGIISKHLVHTRKILGVEFPDPADALLLPVRILRGLGYAIEGETGKAIKGRGLLGLQGKPGEMWLRFVNSKAAHANLVALDQENLRKHDEELVRGARTPWQNLKKAGRNPVRYVMHSHPITLLQELSNLTENSTRLAVFERTGADLMSEGYSRREAEFQAGIAARESSTDFGRSGEYGYVINRIIPFFNAALQGADKLARTLFVDKGGRSAAWSKGVAMITVPSLMLWALNKDKEWYKEQPAWLKNHFWLFSFDDGKTIHRLPKPFEVGLIFGSLPERFLDWAMEDDPKAVQGWVDQFTKDIVPLDPAQLLGPAVGGLVGAKQNFDAFRGTPIVKGWLEDVIPREQYTTSTSEFSKWLGSLGPGGGWSPLKIDYIIRNATGGLGQWGTEIASNIIMQVQPEKRQMKPESRRLYGVMPDWTPILRGLTATTPTKYSRQMDDFYEIYDRGREAVETMRALRSGGGSREKYLQLYRDRGVDIALYESTARMAETLGKISKRMRQIENAPPSVMTRRERRALLDELMAARNKLADKYMARIKNVDRDSIQSRIDASVDRVAADWDQNRR